MGFHDMMKDKMLIREFHLLIGIDGDKIRFIEEL